MKSFKDFLSESVTINGDFNGTLTYGGAPAQPVGEEFVADIVYQGNIHRITMVTETGIPSKNELAEHLQGEYPGAIVHNIFTMEEGKYKVKDDKRYHPAKLDWV